MFETLSYYIYCENESGLIEQPLNLLSSIVFFIGSLWLLTRHKKDDVSPSYYQLTSVLLFVIGLVELFWHVGHTKLAFGLDMFLIFFLITVMMSVVCDDILRVSLKTGLVIIGAVFVASGVLSLFDFQYLPYKGAIFIPPIMFLGFAALKVQKISEETTGDLLMTAYLFLFALGCRSVDTLSCMWFDHGVHFMCHILLVGGVVYLSFALENMRSIPWDDDKEPKKFEKLPEI